MIVDFLLAIISVLVALTLFVLAVELNYYGSSKLYFSEDSEIDVKDVSFSYRNILD